MSRKSPVKITKTFIEKHKPLPSFEWRGPLENYYQDGECYYKIPITVAECQKGSGVSEEVFGHGENSLKRACAVLSQNCNCGNTWHYYT